MYLQNEKLQPLNVGELKEYLQKLDNIKEPTQEELDVKLGQYYHEALKADTSNKHYIITTQPALAADFSINGREIFEQIRKIVCAIINTVSSIDEIINAVLTALAAVIPGGIIKNEIVIQLIKFIINKGYAWLCPIPE